MASAEDGNVGHQLEDLEDIPGLDALSLDPNIGSGTQQSSDQTQPAAAKGTTYSLLDMDLCVDSSLSQPLIPLDIASQDGAAGQSGCTPKWTTEIHEDAADTDLTLKATLEEKFHILMETQKKHKEELQNIVTTLLGNVTTAYERRFQHLFETLDNQSAFLRNQFAANLNWQLTHHHTEILKDIKEFMTPVVQSVDHLHNDVWKRSQSMDSMSQEEVTMKQTLDISALTTVPVQAAPKDDRLGEAQRQCLQSTVMADKAGVLQSPQDSPVSIFREAGRCPVEVDGDLEECSTWNELSNRWAVM